MDLIIFDYDGVIMDSLDFLKKVYKRIADVLGFKMEQRDEQFRELLELDWRETYRKLDIISKDKVNLSEYTYRLFCDKHNHYIRPYAGIPELLETLSRRYKLAIVSNSYSKDITFMLRAHGLDRFFSKIYGGDDGIPKPSPDLLLKCIRHFKVDARKVYFIGDMDGDIIAGKKAKVKTVAVTYGFHLRHRLKDADFTVNSPKELLDLLNK